MPLFSSLAPALLLGLQNGAHNIDDYGQYEPKYQEIIYDLGHVDQPRDCCLSRGFSSTATPRAGALDQPAHIKRSTRSLTMSFHHNYNLKTTAEVQLLGPTCIVGAVLAACWVWCAEQAYKEMVASWGTLFESGATGMERMNLICIFWPPMNFKYGLTEKNNDFKRWWRPS